MSTHGKENSDMLLVGMQIRTNITEISVEVPQKTENRTIQLCHYWVYSQGNEATSEDISVLPDLLKPYSDKSI